MTVNRVDRALVAALLAFATASLVAAQGASQVKDDDFVKGAYFTDTPGLKAPVVKVHVFPKYTADAMRAKIQGVVEVQAVVAADGTVARARVLTSLDRVLGLDDQAVAAAKQWKFEPGQLGGLAVPVVVSVILEFKLH
jgi:TonB family protein